MVGVLELINKFSCNEVWRGICMRNSGVDLTHIFFANDVMLFVEVTVSNVQNTLRVTELFCQGSG